MIQFSILVVDDDKNFIYSLTEVLQMQNWNIDVATNGFDAARMVTEKDYNLVLLDVNMPGINGIETFHKIKEISPKTIVFMMTGGPMDNLRNLQEQGISVAFQKPLDMVRLIDMISNLEQKMNVLIIDDDAGHTAILSDILIKKGFNVLAARTGKDGLGILAETNIDIILLDIKLPDIDGIELLELIKKVKPKAATIAITGYSVNQVMEKVIQKGAYTCFIKPVNLDLLVQEMELLIKTREEKMDCKDSSKPKILIVEDNDSIRETMKDILETEDYEVITAADVAGAKELISANVYNLVLSDLSLGRESGLTLVDFVRKRDKSTVFMIMTGFGSLETAMEAVEKNVDEYITKPVNHTDLLHKVKTHLENQQLNHEKEKLFYELQESHVKLTELSKTDELTSVYNRRHFFEELHSEMQRAKRQKRSLVLVMGDVNGFKKFNDSRGHVEGDRLLKEIAMQLVLAIREYVDKVFRYGGDEFVILMPEMNKESMFKIGERIYNRIEQNFGMYNVGISLGMSYYDSLSPEMPINEFIDSADKKLYQAKKITSGVKVVI